MSYKTSVLESEGVELGKKQWIGTSDDRNYITKLLIGYNIYYKQFRRVYFM